jgi:hypothetical protein
MSESMRIWSEISFNLLYLVVIYWLVILMIRRRGQVGEGHKQLANLFTGPLPCWPWATPATSVSASGLTRWADWSKPPPCLAGKWDWSVWVRWLLRLPSPCFTSWS